MPAPGPRLRGARAHPRPCQGCEPWPRSSAASGLVLATQELGGITGRGTDAPLLLPDEPDRAWTADRRADRGPGHRAQPVRDTGRALCDCRHRILPGDRVLRLPALAG